MEVDANEAHSETGDALVLRTDFSNSAAWEQICAAIRQPVGVQGFQAYVEFLSDPEYDGSVAETVSEMFLRVAFSYSIRKLRLFCATSETSEGEGLSRTRAPPVKVRLLIGFLTGLSRLSNSSTLVNLKFLPLRSHFILWFKIKLFFRKSFLKYV